MLLKIKKWLNKWIRPFRYRRAKRRLLRNPQEYIRFLFRKHMGCEPNLENPQTLNEKLNWLKINWYDPKAPICSDKYLVRQYVEEKGLGHLLNELYAVWDNPDDIDLNALPEKFIMKTTHDSGRVAICTDKANFNLKAAQEMFRTSMKYDYCFISGEWPYHTKHPRIVCEKLLEDKKHGEIYDYKFYCFNGEPYCIFFGSDRKNHVKADYYDLDWNLMPFHWRYETSGKLHDRPECLKEMVEYARILAQGFPFVRVDFYEVEGKVIFGELTFFHGGGFGHYEPEEMDLKMGQMVKLPETKADPWDVIRQSL